MEEDKQNVMMFFIISMLIMVGYLYFFDNNRTVEPTITRSNYEKTDVAAVSSPIAKVASPIQLTKVENITIESKNLSGTISSRGVKIDGISLRKYKKSINDQGNVEVLRNSHPRYFAQTKWTSSDPQVVLPDENSCWKTSSNRLSEDSPVILTWDNGNGLLFEKRISVDNDFLVTIVDVVKNHGANDVSLASVTVIDREFEASDNSMNFYEGPLGYINGKLEEIKYEDIAKQREIHYQTQGGWFGVTDKYWLTAFIPNQKLNHSLVYRHSMDEGKNVYRIESITDPVPIAPSVEISKTHHLFVGAKEIKTLDMYEEKLNVQHFDLAIDFGCLYIITKPHLYALAYTKDLVGNMGLGIILITLLIKLFLLPLANRSYSSMNRMSVVQPKIQELRKKYEGDKVKLGQAISELYKKEGVNPVGGCLPVLLQSPILFALYKVLYISMEMRQAPFIWWIRDLSLPDPSTVLNLFGLVPVNLPGFLQIGIWPLLMGASMLLQQKMSPAPTDPAQAKMMFIMPVMFTFMFAQLPSGLVIYWTFSNILGIAQQYIIKKLDDNRHSGEDNNGKRAKAPKS
ncbi:MAG: membrane protein insertase YidC [Holosporaceae bacterium]|jgi:YidC/Oxa1 family membrane protein insertase|nr:membrane protein insertase YidC [Holosporaceae bacterium]